jgi:hypothetical protein
VGKWWWWEGEEKDEAEGGTEEMDAIEGFEVGIEGDERRRVTSEEFECREVKIAKSSSSSSE